MNLIRKIKELHDLRRPSAELLDSFDKTVTKNQIDKRFPDKDFVTNFSKDTDPDKVIAFAKEMGYKSGFYISDYATDVLGERLPDTYALFADSIDDPLCPKS
jgi:hypothetical protein